MVLFRIHNIDFMLGICFIFDCLPSYAQQDFRASYFINHVQKGSAYLREVKSLTTKKISSDVSEWNINCINNNVSKIWYSSKNDSVIDVLTNQNMYEFLNNSKGLILSKVQNPLTIWKSCSDIVMPNFLSYKDSVLVNFNSIGKYCDKYSLYKDGISKFYNMGCGRLIVNDKDTITNILALKRVTNSTLQIEDNKDDFNKSTNLNEKKIEICWFDIKKMRPIMFKYNVFLLNDISTIKSIEKKYLLTYDDETFTGDSCLNDSNSYSFLTDNNKKNTSIINYNIYPNNNMLAIDYNLNKDAHIKLIISNVSGVVYEHDECDATQNVNYHTELSIASLPLGQYALYVEANEEIHCYKFNKR